jgi:hypothetical protein
MTTAIAPLTSDPIVLCDVDDLAEADLEAELAERLEAAAALSVGSDAVSLAWAICGDGPAAAAAHVLGSRASILAG